MVKISRYILLVISIFLFVYVFYRAQIYSEGTRNDVYFRYYLAALIIVIISQDLKIIDSLTYLQVLEVLDLHLIPLVPNVSLVLNGINMQQMYTKITSMKNHSVI